MIALYIYKKRVSCNLISSLSELIIKVLETICLIHKKKKNFTL